MKLERVSINADFAELEQLKQKVKEDEKAKIIFHDKVFEYAKENFLNSKGEPKWFLRFNFVAWARIGWKAIQLFIEIIQQIKKDRSYNEELGVNIGKSELDNV